MKRSLTDVRVLAVVVTAPLIIALAVIVFAWPGARSEPRGVPVGVVAPASRQDAVRGALSAQGAFAPRGYADLYDVEQAIRERAVDAAVVLTPGSPQLLLASAGGPALVQAIKGPLEQVTGPQVTVTDLVPTPPTDPNGSVLGRTVLPLILGGDVIAVMIGLVLAPGWRQLAAAAPMSAFTGLLAEVVVGNWLGVLGSATWWIAAGVLCLNVLAVTLVVLGFTALLGRVGLPLAIGLLVFLGNAFSGASSAPELLPAGARRIGSWLPPGASNELLRSASFFHGYDWIHATVVLLIWVAFGFGALGARDVFEHRRSDATGRHESS